MWRISTGTNLLELKLLSECSQDSESSYKVEDELTGTNSVLELKLLSECSQVSEYNHVTNKPVFVLTRLEYARNY